MAYEPEPRSAARRLDALIGGAWTTQVVYAAVSLGIPDRLAHGAKRAETLAAAAGAHAPSLFRLLRAMESLGLVSCLDGGGFALTEAGRLLCADVPGSMRGRALFAGDLTWKQFEDLTHSVRTGERARTIGHTNFAEFPDDPGRLDAFQRAMAEISVRAARAAAEAYDFGRFARVLDLGGGYGAVLAVLLEKYPTMRGAVCDLAYVGPGCLAYLAGAGVAARGRFIAGDFFQSVPAGFDAYVLKYIVHDWDDARASTILRRCRDAAGAAARLILLERVMPERLRDTPADRALACADLTMLTVGGQERTAAEYRALLAAAGWRLTDIVPAGDIISAIEAAPA